MVQANIMRVGCRLYSLEGLSLIMQKQRRHRLVFGRMTCAVVPLHLEPLEFAAFVGMFLAMQRDPIALHELLSFVSFELCLGS
jgi:hypothetical protein